MQPGAFPNGVGPVGPPYPLSGAVLLAAWERGGAEPPLARALAMLHAGYPAIGETDAAALPLSTRDLALLALHERSFGPTLAAFATCDACGERFEFTLPARQVAETLQAAEADCVLAHDGGALRLRMANTRDMAEAAAAPDLDAAEDLLLARCMEAADPDTLPAPLREAALARLDAMHDAAEISLALVCPVCDARQTIHLDIASFLWAEVRHAARRLLDEVHELAWAYGWAEAAILAMSPPRRQAYLDRVRG